MRWMSPAEERRKPAAKTMPDSKPLFKPLAPPMPQMDKEQKKMVSQKRAREFTEAEYLMIEEHAAFKSEFVNGRIYAMSGGTPEHSQIAANIIIALGIQLKEKPSRVFTSDMRMKVRATSLLI